MQDAAERQAPGRPVDAADRSITLRYRCIESCQVLGREEKDTKVSDHCCLLDTDCYRPLHVGEFSATRALIEQRKFSFCCSRQDVHYHCMVVDVIRVSSSRHACVDDTLQRGTDVHLLVVNEEMTVINLNVIILLMIMAIILIAATS